MLIGNLLGNAASRQPVLRAVRQEARRLRRRANPCGQVHPTEGKAAMNRRSPKMSQRPIPTSTSPTSDPTRSNHNLHPSFSLSESPYNVPFNAISTGPIQLARSQSRDGSAIPRMRDGCGVSPQATTGRSTRRQVFSRRRPQASIRGTGGCRTAGKGGSPAPGRCQKEVRTRQPRSDPPGFPSPGP